MPRRRSLIRSWKTELRREGSELAYASAILGKVRIHLLISILAASLHSYLITSYT
jgi:hypothetical protein